MTNDTQTLTLTDFLLARIAEDEDLAAGAGHEVDYRSMRFLPVPSCDADHIAHHSPTRVLAECEMKRQLLQEHAAEDRGNNIELCRTCDWSGGDGYPCQTLVIMTLPYRDHPDYREEWEL